MSLFRTSAFHPAHDAVSSRLGQRHMTRLPVLFFLLLALTFSGCKKNKTAAAAKKPDAVASQEVGPAAPAPAGRGEPPPPEKPDFSPAAATPKPAAKPSIDTNASVVAFCYHN